MSARLEDQVWSYGGCRFSCQVFRHLVVPPGVPPLCWVSLAPDQDMLEGFRSSAQEACRSSPSQRCKFAGEGRTEQVAQPICFHVPKLTPLYALPSYPACLTAAEHLAASSCHGTSSCSAFAGCCPLQGGCLCSQADASFALLDIADNVSAGGLRTNSSHLGVPVTP